MTQSARKLAPPSSPDPQASVLLKRLDALTTQQPHLAEMLHFYRTVLPLLQTAQHTVEPFTINAVAAQHKLQAGIPLLMNEELPLDEAKLQRLFVQLCQVVEKLGAAKGRPASLAPGGRALLAFFKRGQPDAARLIERVQQGDETALRAAAAQQLRQTIEQRRLELGEVWMALLAGDEARLQQLAADHKLDGELLRTLGQYTLRPSLQCWAANLQQLADFDNAWSAGVWRQVGCPICGSPPMLSEIQGKEGARRLRCGACGAGWGYPRLFCAFCGNQNYRTIGYISVEDEEEKYRLQTCDTCRGYLKVVVTFDPIPVDLLPVEDLTTLHLDTIATTHGFMRSSTVQR